VFKYPIASKTVGILDIYSLEATKLGVFPWIWLEDHWFPVDFPTLKQAANLLARRGVGASGGSAIYGSLGIIQCAPPPGISWLLTTLTNVN
jgi:hypothetical protein